MPLWGRSVANDLEVARHDVGKRPARTLGSEPQAVGSEPAAQFENAAAFEEVAIKRFHPSDHVGGAACGQRVPSCQELVVRQVD
jgi:hypothetical protein